MALLKFRKGTGSDENTMYLDEKTNKYEAFIGNKKVGGLIYQIINWQPNDGVTVNIPNDTLMVIATAFIENQEDQRLAVHGQAFAVPLENFQYLTEEFEFNKTASSPGPTSITLKFRLSRDYTTNSMITSISLTGSGHYDPLRRIQFIIVR